jgi:hypothetical protein
VHLVSFSLSSACRLGSYMVSQPSSFVNVRASYRYDLVLLVTRVFFGITFPTFISWSGSLFLNVVFSSHLLYIYLWFISHFLGPFRILFYDLFTHGWFVLKAPTKYN